jgi:hypothetical protein
VAFASAKAAWILWELRSHKLKANRFIYLTDLQAHPPYHSCYGVGVPFGVLAGRDAGRKIGIVCERSRKIGVMCGRPLACKDILKRNERSAACSHVYGLFMRCI